MRKRMNFGIWFAIGLGAWYLWKQKKAAATAAALPQTVSQSVTTGS